MRVDGLPLELRFRDCRIMFGPALPEDLRFARCCKHFINYIEESELESILGILRNRSDLPGKLAKLFGSERYCALRGNRDRSCFGVTENVMDTVHLLHIRIEKEP